MPTSGYITSDDLENVLYQRKIVGQILEQAQGYGTLANDSLVKQVSVSATHVSLSTMDSVKVTPDLGELEAANIDSQSFGSIDVDLKADMIRVAFSDESLLNATIADPLALTTKNAAVGFKRTLDNKIATAFGTTPQTTSWDTATQSFLEIVGTCVGLLEGAKLTGLAVSPETYWKIAKSLTTGDGRTAGVYIQDKMQFLAGYDAPINISTSVPANTVYFTSTEVPGAYLIRGQAKTETYRDHDKRATILQANIWNAVATNIRQTDDDLNAGVVKVTVT
ncbi:MAG: hypothetical protein E7Z72_00600 [Methanocorpusculum parvum]|nr:hypothetical protein [Methanocorpusculum parvum]